MSSTTVLLPRMLTYATPPSHRIFNIPVHTLSTCPPARRYALANTLKRSIVVAAALVFFGQRLPPTGLLGASMALLGALCYSLAIQQQQALAAKAAAAEALAAAAAAEQGGKGGRARPRQ
jgi:hypothetical protein